MMKELSAKEMKRKEYSIYLLHKYLLLSCLYYSTVTDFAKFLGWSTLQPRCTAI